MSRIPVIKVNQWLPEWDDFSYNEEEGFPKPEKHFYIFSMKASELRALAGVYRRTSQKNDDSPNLGIQRRHDEERSKQIRDFVHFGHPYSELSQRQRQLPDHNAAKKPGWLPTSIIVNFIGKEQVRGGKFSAHESDIIKVEETQNHLEIITPYTDNNYSAESYPPIEIIDGQHRLYAFNENDDDFELPVVAFNNLSINWQAYLFWVINIKPKKINPSLAYDLYPLLRRLSWLEGSNELEMYRKTRAQEIISSLWSLPISPWYKNIDMLGEGGRKNGVSQSSWINSLINSLFKKSGIFEKELPSWDSSTQVAILCFFGNELKKHLAQQEAAPWYKDIVEIYTEKTDKKLNLFAESHKQENFNPVFNSQYSLLGTDQGIRPVLQLINSLLEIHNDNWNAHKAGIPNDEDIVKEAMQELNKSSLGAKLSSLANALSSFDWRTSACVDSEKEEDTYNLKASFRGGAGYKQLKDALEKHLASLDLTSLISKE